jgi:hypothetical protein
MVIDDPNIGAQRRNGVEPKLRQIWEIAGMCFKHRLTLVKISMLLLVTDFPSAYALSSWDCAGFDHRAYQYLR